MHKENGSKELKCSDNQRRFKKIATTLQDLAAVAKTPLGHEGAVLARKRLSRIPDNHIGLSNSLWATLICFAAQRESRHNAIMPSLGRRTDGFAEDEAQRLMASLLEPPACYLTGVLALIGIEGERQQPRTGRQAGRQDKPRLCEHLLSA